MRVRDQLPHSPRTSQMDGEGVRAWRRCCKAFLINTPLWVERHVRQEEELPFPLCSKWDVPSHLKRRESRLGSLFPSKPSILRDADIEKRFVDTGVCVQWGRSGWDEWRE